MRRDPSLLGYALLGLVRRNEPCSGYDLRKLFSSSPLVRFSDSPGAIYPALKRLEAARLIRGSVERAATVRRRKLYRVTPSGEAALAGWLDRPVTRADVIRGMPELMLRFAFMEAVLGRAACVRFLAALLRELDSYIPIVQMLLRQDMADKLLSSRLALEGGILGYESQRRWARAALRRMRRA